MTRLFGMFGMLASAFVLAGIVAAVAGVILLATDGGQNTFVAVLPSIPGLLLAGTGLAVVGAVLSVIATPSSRART